MTKGLPRVALFLFLSTVMSSMVSLSRNAPLSSDLVLEAISVTKSYGNRQVVDQVSAELRRGERLALTGPSGSGKTTLLNCCGGIDRADSGILRLLNQNLAQLSGEQLSAVRRHSIGTIFQFFHLLPTLTAAENIELPLQLIGQDSTARKARVCELLERIQLTSRAGAFPAQLSGGEMQRIAIARALAHRPALLLADEPTGNLDSANGEKILTLLKELSDETGTAILLVTHSEQAAAICHRVLHMRDGRIERESEA